MVQHPPKKVVCGRKAIWIDVTMAVGMFLPSTQELRAIIDPKATPRMADNETKKRAAGDACGSLLYVYAAPHRNFQKIFVILQIENTPFLWHQKTLDTYIS